MSSKKTILVVDDSATNINVIGDILSPFYLVKAANSGQKALNNIIKKPAADLVLLDVMMPEMDGYEVIKALKADDETRDIPVIFVTAMDDTEDEEKGLKLGAVDYITKPVRPAILLARVKTHIELKQARDQLQRHNLSLGAEVEQRIAERDLIKDISMKALSSLAKTRDNETGNHILRTQGYVEVLARHLAVNSEYRTELSEQEIENICKAAPLHDIGKVGIPDAILLKEGKLTYNEFELMKEHAQIGAESLKSCIQNFEGRKELTFLQTAVEIANYHHEKWDGGGYPEGLSGLQIPLSARLMALADVFDALISKRCYKPAFSLEESINTIMQGKGNHFDPLVVDAFAACQQQFIDIAEKYHD